MTIPFVKFHGFGNDYIVIQRGCIPEGTKHTSLAVSICDRHLGAGADGIAILERLDSEEADFTCEIINPDGSIAGFSGNGTRCAVAYLHHNRMWTDPVLRLKTRSGIKTYKLIDPANDGEYWFEAEIGRPMFAGKDVPIACPGPLESVVDIPITVDGSDMRVSAVNVGNPVACVFVKDFSENWREIGRVLETHAVFPDRANIVFLKVQHPEHIEVRIWERGAGETAASGTCSAAAAVLSAFTKRTGRAVNVHSPGGVTRVVWREDDEIVLTGKASFVYSGDWPA